MSIHNRVQEAYKYKLLAEFKENKYLPQTPEGLLEFLFDDDSEYRIYYYNDPWGSSKRTIGNRLNTLWMLPIWAVCAPFLWLFTGEAGINQHSKLGKWIAKVTGL
jgi:hypothetical protein